MFSNRNIGQFLKHTFFFVLFFCLIGLIQVYNWEIWHHSLVCCCGLADILHILALVMSWVQIASPLTFFFLSTGISGTINMSYLINILFIITIIIIIINLLINYVFIFHSTPSDPHPATDSFLDYVYFHRSSHLFIRGGYTSPTAHAYDLRHVFARPVEDRLFLRVLNFSLQ